MPPPVSRTGRHSVATDRIRAPRRCVWGSSAAIVATLTGHCIAEANAIGSRASNTASPLHSPAIMTPTAAHLPRFRHLPKTGRRRRTGAGLSPAGRRLAHAGLGLPQDRRRPLRLPVRERRGRRKGRPLQLSRRRSVLRDRGLRPSRDDQRLLGRFGRRRADAGHAAIRLRKPAGRASPPGRGGPGGASARAAAVLQRSGRLRRLRHGPLHREPAQRPGRRPPRARPGLRVLRSDGRFRQRDQGDRRRGDGPARQGLSQFSAAKMGLSLLSPRPTKPPAAGSIGWSKSSRPRRAILQPFDIRTDRRRVAALRVELRQGRFRGGRPQVRRIHPRRRHFPGRAQPAAENAAPHASVRDLPHAPRGQSQPVHVLRPHAERHAGRQLAGGDGPRGRWPGDRSPVGRHPPARQDRGGRPAAGRGIAGRSEGAGRARDAGRSGPQRRGPRGRLSARSK